MEALKATVGWLLLGLLLLASLKYWPKYVERYLADDHAVETQTAAKIAAQPADDSTTNRASLQPLLRDAFKQSITANPQSVPRARVQQQTDPARSARETAPATNTRHWLVIERFRHRHLADQILHKLRSQRINAILRQANSEFELVTGPWPTAWQAQRIKSQLLAAGYTAAELQSAD